MSSPPVINGPGVSDHTPLKQEALREIIKQHIIVTTNVIRKYRNSSLDFYTFVDATAGTGWLWHKRTKTNIVGSPLVTTPVLKKAWIDFRLHMFERDEESCLKLVQCMNEEFDCALMKTKRGDAPARWYDTTKKIRIYNGSYDVMAKQQMDDISLRTRYGLIYIDPNGHPDWKTLRTLASDANPRYGKMEILIHVGATSLKRSGVVHNQPRLREYLCSIPKQHWHILKFKDTGKSASHQWVFLLGSNWISFKPTKKIGFVSIKSPEGQELLDRLNFTEEELKKLRNNRPKLRSVK
jgi:three-Cys-motif partner protein